MTGYSAPLRSFALSATLFTASTAGALSQDANAIADRLKGIAAEQGVRIEWSGVNGDASSMVIEGLTVTFAGEPEAMAIGDLTLSGIAEKDGGYVIDTLSTTPFKMAEGNVSITASPFILRGLTLPAKDPADPMSSITMYESASLDELSIVVDGKTAFALKGLVGTVTPPDGTSPLLFTSRLANFSTDLTLIEEPGTKTYIDALGYSRLEGTVDVEGSWQPTDGSWSMSRYDVQINDVGTLGMTIDLSGLTPALIKSANEISAKMAEAPEGASTSAHEAQLMDLMQDVTFHGASLRFSDASLTNRIVDLVASAQGVGRAEVIAMAKGAIPFAMVQFQMAELAGAVLPAINAFLDEPKSIEIVVAPPAPVTFAQIGEVSMAAPGDTAATANAVWSLLGVQVKANQ